MKRKWNPYTLLVDMKNGATMLKNYMEVSYKVKRAPIL